MKIFHIFFAKKEFPCYFWTISSKELKKLFDKAAGLIFEKK